MSRAFKPILQARVIKERKEAEEQEALRKKYGIKSDKKIEVKKEHIVTSLCKVLGAILRKFFIVLLIFLAWNGLVALIQPDSRAMLQYVYADVFHQLEMLFPAIAEFIKN